ncbi:imidazole glycerol phosphate synthase subunit HisH [Corynebacterium yudongzhengii]|uniref:Imidazole glycerol phosphate synthase subunit HisH n=1 Tax=Corynebacterium yudongzhengii TaxID=2080740 RepID=A0A2U1T6I6_9CORY|nr:imidazole glycerol phosphate synthase subunit HisH [Corynebacterium yudongzhengii]AWB82936.1 imidazole glycerol phosphate synthase subunit HisH [Corynebacterium yudongzhengii]PWC01631.1 imidazole glycerol phosphate synthase subunit HisH [Corynebacterium yudongzhengii]
MKPRVALLDYGSGNLRSAHRALERVGAEVTVTSDPKVAVAADGLLVPGVGAFAACMQGLKAVRGERVIGERLAGDRPVMGICVGMQILFERGTEHGHAAAGCGEWPGEITRLEADILPHMGWNTVEIAKGSRLFDGIADATRFYFVHSYAARSWELNPEPPLPSPQVSWAQHGGDRFVAAVENGPLWATQFHPEKSGDAGAHLLENWLASFR